MRRIIRKRIGLVIMVSLLVLQSAPVLTQAQDQDTTVVTGDAESTVVAENTVNNNEVDTTGDDTDSVVVDVTNDAGLGNSTETDGTTGENTVEQAEGATTVDTGEVKLYTGVENTVNHSDVDVQNCDCLNDESQDTADSTAEFIENDAEAAGDGPPLEVTIGIESDANVNNTSTVSGVSGSNTAKKVADVYIKTGNIRAHTEIANYINNVVIGSGLFDVINIYDVAGGTLDLSGFGFTSPNVQDAEVELGGTSSTTAEVNSIADVSTDVQVDLSTGANSVEDATGDVLIDTGDIFVKTSVLNVVNTNFIGRDWKMKIINIYSDSIGDLILPPLQDRSQTGVGCSGCVDLLGAHNSNTASVSNAVATLADSGMNTSTSTDQGASVDTGNTFSHSSVFNLVNSNIIGDDWYYSHFYISGSWNGSVYNTTDATRVERNGSRLGVFDSGGSGESDAQEAGSNESSTLNTFTTNDATVSTNVDVNASTGSNMVTNASGTAHIVTGNVFAFTDVSNLVNANFIGSGWQFYLINIFGDWNGGLHYGMPDMAISEVAVPQSDPLGPGQTVEYVLSYTNGGDAPAKDVTIIDAIDLSRVNVADGSGAVPGEDRLTWRLGTVHPGETRLVNYSVQYKGDESIDLTNAATVSTSNGDRDDSNNITGGSIRIASPGVTIPPSYGSDWIPNPNWSLTKTANKNSITAGEMVDYRVALDNRSLGEGRDVYVLDVLSASNGTIVTQNDWNLGTVASFEIVYLDYTLELPSSLAAGIYTNTVKVFSKNVNNFEVAIREASHVLQVAANTGYTGPSASFGTLGFSGDLYPKNGDSSGGSAQANESDIVRVVEQEVRRGVVPESDSGTPRVLGFTIERLPEIFTSLGSKMYTFQPVEVDNIENNFGWAFLAGLLVTILFYIARRNSVSLSRDKLKV